MTRKLLFLLLALHIGASGCSRPAQRADTVILDPVRAVSPQAQERYDLAVQMMTEGRWEEAREAFLALQTEYPQDPISSVAELYSARASLRDFQVGALELRNALSVFSGLAADEGVDGRVRFAARIYQATSMVLLGESQAALEYLGREGAATLSPTLLVGDRSDAWALLVEALQQNSRHEDAMIALDRAWQEAETDELRAFVVSRAFEIIPLVPDTVADDWTTASSPILRGLASWRVAHRLAASGGDPGTLQELVQRAVTDLKSLGEDDRAAQIAQLRPTKSFSGPLRIGVLLPQSGTNAAVGLRAMRGAYLARDAFGARRADGITLLMEDSSKDVEAAMKRLEDAGVSAIIGPVDAAQARTVATTARNLQIPVLALTNEIPLEEDSWVFRNFLDAEAEARLMAKIARHQLRHDRVHVIFPDIGYGRRMATAFRAEFEKLGGQVVLSEAYDRTAKDYSKLANRVASSQAGAIFIPDAGSKVAEVTAFLAAKNIWGQAHDAQPIRDNRTRVHYLGTSLWQDETLTRQAGNYVRGAILPVWVSPTLPYPKTQSFFQSYRQSWTSEPGDLEAFTYDSVSLIVEAIEQYGASSPRDIRNLLTDTTAYRGVTGDVRFNTNGSPLRVPHLVELRDQFSPLPDSWIPKSEVDRRPAQD